METFKTFLKPVIDLKGTGAQIKRLRKLRGYSVHVGVNISEIIVLSNTEIKIYDAVKTA